MSKRNIVHVEIPAADLQGTSSFYQKLFGWKIRPMPEMNYTMWEAADGSGGGFPAASADNPAGQVLIYIASDDIEADLKNVEILGGTVLTPKTEIPSMGWFGIFKDPTDNVIGLYTDLNPS
ncbi:MAG: VOC family protein [Anaerolineales bacterium]|nr:VOC family protein [Anaerolineales bacterium]